MRSDYMICKQCDEEFTRGTSFVSPHTGRECFNWAEEYGFCKPSCYVTWMTENKQWSSPIDVRSSTSRAPRSRRALNRVLDIFKR